MTIAITVVLKVLALVCCCGQGSYSQNAAAGLSAAATTTTTTTTTGGHELIKRFFAASVLSATAPTPYGAADDKAPNSRQFVEGVLEKFHVNFNTIIKTGDSRALGAKYLNESELVSKEDCMLWCWETNPCNLAVYEEKVLRKFPFLFASARGFCSLLAEIGAAFDVLP